MPDEVGIRLGAFRPPAPNPEHLSGKGRELRGIRSFLRSLGPCGWLGFYSLAGDVVG